MVIELRLYGSLRKYRPTMSEASTVTADVPDGISLGEFLDEMEIDAVEIRSAAVNGADSDLARLLSDGDRVELFPPGVKGKS